MKVETFSDGSTIETDELTGERTIFGVMAHAEYFARLRREQEAKAEQERKPMTAAEHNQFPRGRWS